MARFYLLFITVFTVSLSIGNAYYDFWECPPVGSKDAFDCPRSYDPSDYDHCCDQGHVDQECCTFDDYYGYWSTGAIFAVITGGVIGFCLLVTLAIVCCVCAGRRSSPPVLVTHSQVVQPHQYNYGVSMPPPAYNVAVAQPPKPAEYGQYANEATQPIN